MGAFRGRRKGNSISGRSITNRGLVMDDRRVTMDSSISTSATTPLSSLGSASSASFGSEKSMVSTVISLPHQNSKSNWEEFIVSKIEMLFRKQFSMVSEPMNGGYYQQGCD